MDRSSPSISTLVAPGLALALLLAAFPLYDAAAARPTDSLINREILLQNTPGLAESLEGHTWQAMRAIPDRAEIITRRGNEICRTSVSVTSHASPTRTPGSLRRTFRIDDEVTCAPLERPTESTDYGMSRFPRTVAFSPRAALRDRIQEALPESICYPGLTIQLHLAGGPPAVPEALANIREGAALGLSFSAHVTVSASSRDAPNAANECIEAVLPTPLQIMIPNFEAILPLFDEAPETFHLLFQVTFPERDEPPSVEIAPKSIQSISHRFRDDRCFHLFHNDRPVQGFMLCS